MSLEDLLKENTAALIANTAAVKEMTETMKLVSSVAPVPADMPAPAPAAPAPAPAAPAPAPAAPAPAPAAPAPAPGVAPAPAPGMAAPQMSPEELNAAVVAEYNRLGGNPAAMGKIQGVFKLYNVPGITHLKPEQYAEVLQKVKELT